MSSEKLARLRLHAAALAALVVAWLVYAGPLLSPRTNLYAADTYCQDVPLRIYAARMIRNGEFPHWTPDLNCGYPLFADGQTGVLYPFFLLYIAWPTPEAHDWFMALHFLLIGTFTYLFLTSRQISPSASLIGAVTFMASSYHQTNHVVPGCLATATWLPLSLYLVQCVARGRRGALYGAALVNAVALLAGHVQVSLISYSVQALWLLYTTWRPAAWQLMRRAVVLFVLPLALCAVQMLPTAQFLSESDRSSGLVRSALDAEAFFAWGIHWRHLLTFFWPWAVGSPWNWTFTAAESAGWEEVLVVYQGFAAIALLPAGIFLGRPRQEVWFWTGVLLLGLALSGSTPVRWLLMYVPPYNLFRWPARYMLLASVAVSALVALGAEALFDRIRDAWLPRRRLWSNAIVVGVVVASLGGAVCFNMSPYLTDASFYSIASPALLAAARQKGHFRLLPLARALDHCGRLDAAQYRRNAATLPVSYNLFFDAAAATVLDQGNAVGPRVMSDLMVTGHANVLKIAAVTHLSAPAPLEQFREEPLMAIHPVPLPESHQAELVASSPAYVYRYRSARPRAWMVYRTRVIRATAERLSYIFAPTFEPENEAVVEEAVRGFEKPGRPADVRVRQPRKDRLEIDVQTETEGLLVVADYHTPTISATIDGRPAKMVRTNHAFRGIVVPTGRHRVVMSYRHGAFSWGLLVSSVALAVNVIGLWSSAGGTRERGRRTSSIRIRLAYRKTHGVDRIGG